MQTSSPPPSPELHRELAHARWLYWIDKEFSKKPLLKSDRRCVSFRVSLPYVNLIHLNKNSQFKNYFKTVLSRKNEIEGNVLFSSWKKEVSTFDAVIHMLFFSASGINWNSRDRNSGPKPLEVFNRKTLSSFVVYLFLCFTFQQGWPVRCTVRILYLWCGKKRYTSDEGRSPYQSLIGLLLLLFT